jgi:hypothetical protein
VRERVASVAIDGTSATALLVDKADGTVLQARLECVCVRVCVCVVRVSVCARERVASVSIDGTSY